MNRHRTIYEWVGGNAALRADVRLVCATNLNLKSEVLANRFRVSPFWRGALLIYSYCWLLVLRRELADEPTHLAVADEQNAHHDTTFTPKN